MVDHGGVRRGRVVAVGARVRLHVHQRVLVPGDVGERARLVRHEDGLDEVAQLLAAEVPVGGHGVHVVVRHDDEVGGRWRVGELPLQPPHLLVRVLPVLVARLDAVLALDERRRVQEDGDEVVGEFPRKVRRRHVPARLARGEGDLRVDVAVVVVVAQHRVPGDVGEDEVVVDVAVASGELVVVDGGDAVGVEVVASGDDEMRVVALFDERLLDGVGHGLGDGLLAVLALAAPVAEGKEGERDVRDGQVDWAGGGDAGVDGERDAALEEEGEEEGASDGQEQESEEGGVPGTGGAGGVGGVGRAGQGRRGRERGEKRGSLGDGGGAAVCHGRDR